ncbi:hypothetical protein HY500_04185 [Candidatus Woesearchaeota archaeon]|nr:hypothetical protein [Candidatus Woesearchaeota archaeon]
MAKPPKLEEIFSPEPNRVNLTGFSHKDAPVLRELEETLGKEPLLRGSKRIKRAAEPISLGFNPEFIEQRQAFFRKAYGISQPIRSHFLERGLEEIDEKYKRGQTKRGFLEICRVVSGLLESSREELRPFTSFAETRRVLGRINEFDSNLEGMLRTLRAIGEIDKFAIDVSTGIFAPIEEIPPKTTEYLPSEKEMQIDMRQLLRDIRFGLKKNAISLVEGMGVNFERRIREFVRDELRVRPGEDNLRRAYEILALPIRLGIRYQRFLDSCESYNFHDSEDEELLEDEEYLDLLPKLPSIPDSTYPEFRSHYDIRNLFPPKLMTRWELDGRAVPMNFRSGRSERKFLLAGLHSGGKSFFLDNIILISVLGQAGFCLPGEKIVLPTYERISYYRNPDNSSKGLGKLETEVKKIGEIARTARTGDLIVVDEFLDSTTTEIAGSLGELMIDRLGESKATVMITTHKDTDYRRHEIRGWTIMSPTYSISGGKVKLGRSLKRGPPEEGVNKRYVLERYRGLF